MSYDPKCEELARHFLGENFPNPLTIQDLAQAIQNEVEDWIGNRAEEIAVAYAERQKSEKPQ